MAILIVLIVIVLGVHSCQISARNSSLRDYNHSVSSLIQESNQTGTQFFNLLSGGSGASDPQGLTNQLNETRVSADAELSRAKALDVPSEVSGAHEDLIQTLTHRRDGIADVAVQIQKAIGASGNQAAINQIATDMARFLASDVIYKTNVATGIAAALHAAGIAVGPNGEQIEGGQFLPDVSWLTPSFIATKLGSSSSSTSGASGPPAPGTHGHSLDSVSVGGTPLTAGSTNTIPASPAPSFTVNLTNSGQNDEKNVVVKVEVAGTNDSAQTTIPTTSAGQSTSATVTLPTPPPKGNYTLKVTVEPVNGEKNTSNNSQSFPVTFT
ncbi:MAG: CARDB domain-containing protein [Solirubrobacteraceae bacterium]